MKILLTGASGFIGSRVARLLGEQGHELRLLLRTTSKTDRLAGVTFERATGDITDPVSLAEACRGMDAVIHLACVSAWSDIRSASAEKLESIAVGGTRNLLEAARDAKVKRFVHVSSATTINASDTPRVFDETAQFSPERPELQYSIVKRKAERVVASFVDVLDVVTVCPAEVYGPNDDAFVTAGNIRDIIKNWPALACHGGISVVHVDDVASGIALALEKGKRGERYILGGDNLSIPELCKHVLDLAGLRRRVVPLPNRLVMAACKAAERLHLPPPLPLDVLDYATLYWFVDSSKARRELGYAPRGADATLEPVVRWLRDAGHV
ncbi:MAG: epimerase [Labilithrix sp.]|nr:epimerase [Labilithrix sp.]